MGTGKSLYFVPETQWNLRKARCPGGRKTRGGCRDYVGGGGEKKKGGAALCAHKTKKESAIFPEKRTLDTNSGDRT